MVETRTIGTLSIRTSLLDAGYRTTVDILAISAQDLCTELGISNSQAEDLLKQCRDPPESSSPRQRSTTLNPLTSQIDNTTAASLLSQTSLSFSTTIDALDAAITPHTCPWSDSAPHTSGKSRRAVGISLGQSAEIAGPPGIGKTSIAVGMIMDARLQACLRHQKRMRKIEKQRVQSGKERSRSRSRSRSRPREDVSDYEEEVPDLGTAQKDGEVLLIEGGIPPDKLYRLAELMVHGSGVSPKEILDGIHLVRIATQIQMIAFLNLMDEWLCEHPAVNLIVIDTLSYHFRQPYLDLSTKRRIMDLVKQQIAKATTVHHCAVIVVNQMATKLLSSSGKRVNFDTGERAVLMPQLGDQWMTAKTIQIALFRGQAGDELRYAHVANGPNGGTDGAGWVKFDIDHNGLPMDVEEI